MVVVPTPFVGTFVSTRLAGALTIVAFLNILTQEYWIKTKYVRTTVEEKAQNVCSWGRGALFIVPNKAPLGQNKTLTYIKSHNKILEQGCHC